jgi:hypothetical protein
MKLSRAADGSLDGLALAASSSASLELSPRPNRARGMSRFTTRKKPVQISRVRGFSQVTLKPSNAASVAENTVMSRT